MIEYNDFTAWSFLNPVLPAYEIGIDTTNSQFRVGNGHDPFLSLPAVALSNQAHIPFLAAFASQVGAAYNLTSGACDFNGAGQGSPALVPTGTIILWAQFGQPVPNGWLLCDGTLWGRTQFPALAALIDSAFNQNNDPPQNFRVPNITPLAPKVGNKIEYIIKT